MPDIEHGVATEIVELARAGQAPHTISITTPDGITAPIIGPRTMEHLDDQLAVLDKTLSPDLAEAMDKVVPPGGNVTDYLNSNEWANGKGRFLFPPQPIPQLS